MFNYQDYAQINLRIAAAVFQKLKAHEMRFVDVSIEIKYQMHAHTKLQ